MGQGGPARDPTSRHSLLYDDSPIMEFSPFESTLIVASTLVQFLTTENNGSPGLLRSDLALEPDHIFYQVLSLA